jgi:hypothetical protein
MEGYSLIMKGKNLFLVGVTFIYLGTQYISAVYLKGLRSADITSASVACVQLAFLTTYRKELVILLCLKPRASAETYNLSVHKPSTVPFRYSYSACTFRLSPQQHAGTLDRTKQYRGDVYVFLLEGLSQISKYLVCLSVLMEQLGSH